MSAQVNFTVTKDDDLGLYKGDLTIELPPITVTRYKADRSDFQYEMRSAVENIIGEVVDKAMKEY
jgi:hypothetical protein